MADVHMVRHRRPRLFRRVDRQETDLMDDEVRRRYRFSTDNIDRLVGLLEPSVVPVPGLQNAHIPRDWEPATNRYSACWAARDRTVSCARDVECHFVTWTSRQVYPTSRRVHPTSRRVYPTSRRVKPTSSLEDDEDDWCRPDVDSSRCPWMFTSVNACWPGCCHDSHIFRMSKLGQHMANHHQDPERGYLLGDSGYPCRPFLLTPFLQPESEGQERYNAAHIGTRNSIERAFGVWKRTFHVHHGEIRMKPAKVTRIIIACAVLHNLRLMWGEPAVDPEPVEEVAQGDMFQAATDGRRVRDTIVENYFS
ncbi:putative nuclease HARBI1 isoform X2 [Dreissena polymorpha]|uniref:putative nuclease HARBI1 isoform X2 n=1 Tax=Dreissena polymorpha TaxID=45954 RepID=UPI0022642406|nr:putative nuclease HARBI1 isoform X2 [Dreissena polymorpha]